jgi:hypothetical protein
MSKPYIDPRARQDDIGPIRFMVRSGGYVMCRRPRCIPFVLSEKEWSKLPIAEPKVKKETANGQT